MPHCATAQWTGHASSLRAASNMAIVRDFCFWFSVRLGAIIIGCLTLLQSSVLLTLSIMRMDQPEEIHEDVDQLEESAGPEGILKTIIASKACLTGFAVFFTVLIFACVLLVIGSLQCKPRLMYPFLLMYLVFIAIVTTGHVLLMMGFKNEDYGLGQLILYSNIGGFLIMYLLYTWTCVFSLAQIIIELRHEIDKKQFDRTVLIGHGLHINSAHIGKQYLN